MLVLYMIDILPPLGKYEYDTWRILPVKCYIDNSVHLWSCIRNVNSDGAIDTHMIYFSIVVSVLSLRVKIGV
jgi:hypothetical protein